MTGALCTVQRTADVEHKLEDLARRLAKELGIELRPDRRYHGISAPTWLSGKNREFSMDYSDGMIYSDGKGGVEYDRDEWEYIPIKKIGREYPAVVIINSQGRYKFDVEMPDYLFEEFIGRKKFDPLELPNQFYTRLALKVLRQTPTLISELKEPKEEDVAYTLYRLGIGFTQEDIDDINGEVVRYCLS